MYKKRIVLRQIKETIGKYFIMKNGEAQKKMILEQLSDEELGKLYGKRKIDVEPFFGFLKANLGFTRISVGGKPKVENELGFALMAVNLRRYTASSRIFMYKYIFDFKKEEFHTKTRCEIPFFFILASYIPALLCFFRNT